MLTIRLTRKGKKNQPFFRVVVIDKRRSAKGGRAVEILGFVDPLNKKKSLKKERILYWIKNGAQPSATMHNLLVKEKIISAKKIHVSKKPEKGNESATPTAPTAPVASQTPMPEALLKPAENEPEAIKEMTEIPKKESESIVEPQKPTA